MNKVMLAGRVGKDIDLRELKNEMKVGKFSVATNKRIKINEEWETQTAWHNCTIWTKFNPKINKGDLITIEGELEYSEHDGKHYTNIIVSKYDVLVRNEKTESEATNNNQAPPIEDNGADEGDDLPF